MVFIMWCFESCDISYTVFKIYYVESLLFHKLIFHSLKHFYQILAHFMNLEK